MRGPSTDPVHPETASMTIAVPHEQAGSKSSLAVNLSVGSSLDIVGIFLQQNAKYALVVQLKILNAPRRSIAVRGTPDEAPH